MNSSFRMLVGALTWLILSSCGGGSGGTGVTDSGGVGGTGVVVVSSGVMTKGSVILNGVHYDDSAASVLVDDKPTSANLLLRDGMVVKVLGRIDASGRNGTAQQVEAQIEVRGTALVTPVGVAANPQQFEVLGQTVIVDDLTVLSNIVGPITVALNGALVEVHGLRDATGKIRASRLEANTVQMAESTVDEIRGTVSNLAGNTFNLGSQQILISGGAAILPTGASIANGKIVEVHCSVPPCVNGALQFVASRIELEDAEDVAFQPGTNQRYELEGLVSGFAGHPGNFLVDGVPVTTSASTRFVGGISTDLGNDIDVEAEGAWDGSKLLASKIEFKRSVIRLQGVVTVSGASSFTLQIGAPAAARNVLVESDNFTLGAVPPVGPTCVQVRGQRKVGGGVVVTAGKIDTNCSNGGDHALQAPVDTKVEPNLTLLGFTVNVAGASFRDIDNNLIDQGTFFGLVSATNNGPPFVAGTLVRIRFDKNNLSTVREVELED